MSKSLTLLELQPGQRGRVQTMDLTGALRRRLRDIGLIEGAAVECVGRSPGGDPAAYLLCGAVIALRAQEAETIRIIRE